MIRKAAANDVEGVYHLINLLEKCEFPKTQFFSVYNEILQNESHCIFLYENENEILGIAHLRIENQLHHCGRVAEIMELIVDDSCRSKGIGTKLFHAVCNYAKERCCTQIEVASNCSRTRAHTFYQKKGMRPSHYKFTMLP